MSWPALMTSLVSALALDGAVSADVQRGATAQVHEKRTVVVSRRGGSPRQTTDWVGGTTRLWLECWEYDLDHGVADAALDDLENAVQTAVQDWLDGTPVAGLVVTGQIAEIVGDEDTFRPSVGSRMALDLHWRQVP